MPKSEKNTPVNRINIIGSVTSPLGFYVLALLIIEAFLGTALVAGGLEAKNKFDVIVAALAVFVIVVAAVTLLVWARPSHIMLNSKSTLPDSGKIVFQGEFKASGSETIQSDGGTPSPNNPVATQPSGDAEKAAAATLLRKYWKPDGKTIDKQHEARLKMWKEAKGLADVSITALINVEMFAQLRNQAIHDLDIVSGENHEKD